MSLSRHEDFMRGTAILCTALATIDNTDRHGRTQLWWATFEGHTDMAKVLIGLGADVDKKGMGIFSLIKCTISTDIPEPGRENADGTPLSASLVAAVLGHHEILRCLLDAGALVDQSISGCSLWAAAANGHKDVCELLFQVANWDNDIIYWSIRQAAANGHADVEELLINHKTREGSNILIIASRQGHRELVELLINDGADVESKEYDGSSSLLISSLKGHIEVVKVLINAGADVESKDIYGRSSLFAASIHGHREVVEVLINAGADLETKNNDRRSSLYVASYQGHMEVVEVLINAGADVESKDNTGTFSLFAASMEGHRKVVEVLINAGADAESKDNYGRSSLCAASYQGHKDVVEFLIYNARADLESKNDDGWSSLFAASQQGHRKVVDVLIHAGADIESKTNNGQFPLYVASSEGHSEVVEALINAGADVESKTDNGRFALFVASSEGHREVAKVLISAGAAIESKDNNGWTSLCAASYQGHKKVVEYLINAGADIKSRSNDGWSSLFAASSPGHKKVVEYLINAGADVDSKDNDGRSSLCAASTQGHKEVVEVLINAGANVNSKLNNGRFSLFLASSEGHREVVEVLIHAGAHVNAKDNTGLSSLVAASFQGHSNVVEVLINEGADVESENNLHKTALMLATENGHLDTVRLLISHEAKIPFEILLRGIHSGNKDLINFLINIDNLFIDNPFIGDAMELAIRRTSTDLLQKLVIRSQYAADTSGCSLGVYRMLMILADNYGTPTPRPTPILEFLKNRYFRGGFSIQEHCSSPGPQPIPNTSEADVNLLIKYPGIGSIEYAPMGMAKKISKDVDFNVKALGKHFPDNIYITSVERCGSTAEGTSTGLPDEYDYLFKVTTELDKSELVDHGHGYRYFETKKMWVSKGSKHFHDAFWAGLENVFTENKEFETVIDYIPNVQDGGNASTEVKIRCFLPDTNHLFLVSVDCVPVIHFDNAWPEKGIQRTWLMDKKTLQSRGFALVAKPPHRKSRMGKAMKEINRVKLYRVSCSHLEAEHIASLDARVKNAFIAAKCIRNPEVCRIFMKESDGVLCEVDKYLTTYLLKTVFLHNVEDFLATEKTLLHMVYIIYNKLEVCLAKEFLPNFWENHVNVLEGLSIDAKKSLQVVRLMIRLICRWYDAVLAGVSEGATASGSEGGPPVGYHAYEFDGVA